MARRGPAAPPRDYNHITADILYPGIWAERTCIQRPWYTCTTQQCRVSITILQVTPLIFFRKALHSSSSPIYSIFPDSMDNYCMIPGLVLTELV